jgi:nicotinamidase-related amidase
MAFTEDVILRAAREAYERGEASFIPKLSRCALLVIDMQDEFVRPGWTSSWIPEATRQVPRIRRVVDFCRRSAVPVLFTVFSATCGYRDRPRSGPQMPNRFPALGDDPAWFLEGRVWDELRPLPGEVVLHKPSYGAFFDTPLDTILRSMGRDTVIICGTLTNCCCGATARQAYERGYYVVFGSDVTSTYDDEMQRAELSALRFAFAKIMSADEILRIS